MSVADPGGGGGLGRTGHIMFQNVLYFMQIFGNVGKILSWRPPLEGWHPLLEKSCIFPLKWHRCRSGPYSVSIDAKCLVFNNCLPFAQFYHLLQDNHLVKFF